MNINKKGLSALPVILIVIGAMLAVGLVVYYTTGGGAEEILKKTPAGGCPESTATLTVNTPNAEALGTSVSTNLTAGVVGSSVGTTVTSGTTTFPVDKKVNILVVGNGAYIDTSVLDVEIECGGTEIDVPIYASAAANPTIRIINDEGDYMTDAAAGNVNQTDIAAGESLSVTVEFSGTSQESTGDGVFIVETAAGTGINISRIELDGVEGVAVPGIHAGTTTGGKFLSFDIPAIVGTQKVKKTLTFVSKSATADFSGAVLTDWYAKQDFVDTNGQITSGIEDANGNAKYEKTLDSDFFIDAA